MILVHIFSCSEFCLSYFFKPFPTLLGWYWDNLPFSPIFMPIWGLFRASVTHIWFKMCSHVPKLLLGRGCQHTLSSIWSKIFSFDQKSPKRKIQKTALVKIYILFISFSNGKKGEMLQCPNGSFAFIRYGWTSLGCFPRPKKCNFEP